MKLVKWLPLIATMGLIYFLRWTHIGVTDFKIFVLVMVAWSLLLIMFYKHTADGQAQAAEDGDLEDVGLSTED